MLNTLKVERAILNYTQDDLAKLIGVSRQTINSIEKNRYVPSTLLALKISKTFGKTVNDIFTLEEEQTFETERLILRPTSMEDVDFIIALMNMPKWYKFIGDRNVRTKEEGENYLRNKIIKGRIQQGVPNYTLIRKSDNKKVGKRGLVNRK